MTMETKEYNDLLKHLEFVNPDHPQLERLKQGLTLTNEIRLQKALASLPPAPEPEARRSGDAILDRFFTQLNKAFTLRAQASNKFHRLIHTDKDGLMTMRDESEAKKIVTEIEGHQRTISDLLSRMRHYESTSELLPSTVEGETFQVPTDPIELMKKLNSLRAGISRTKKDLTKIVKKSNPDKWNDVNENLQRLTTQLKHVEAAISTVRQS